MKKPFFLIASFIFSITYFLNAQESGNINYQSRDNYYQSRLSDDSQLPNFNTNNEFIISVKGMKNIKADTYVAIFSTNQTGKTTQEVNELLNLRIKSTKEKIKAISENIVFYTDMISFVPIYEYEVEKKIFSRKTYNEIPKGFELKKNIHIKFNKHSNIDKIISICAENEIYDLVRVDYFVENMEKHKNEIRTKAQKILEEKKTFYQTVLNMDFSKLDKELIDGYTVYYPVEKYNSYQAYSSNSLNIDSKSKVNTQNKSTTAYYMPVFDKSFDFVINPVIVEPVVQIIYDIKLKIKFEEKQKETEIEKQYFFITPNGEMKKLQIE